MFGFFKKLKQASEIAQKQKLWEKDANLLEERVVNILKCQSFDRNTLFLDVADSLQTPFERSAYFELIMALPQDIYGCSLEDSKSIFKECLDTTIDKGLSYSKSLQQVIQIFAHRNLIPKDILYLDEIEQVTNQSYFFCVQYLHCVMFYMTASLHKNK